MSAFDHHAQLAISRARPGLAKLAAWLIELSGFSERSVPFRISRETRLICLRLLRPAEALLRRLIVAMAIDLIADETLRSSVRPDPSTPLAGTARGKRRSARTSAAGFRLFETIPGLGGYIS